MNNLLFTAIIIALLYYFFYYLPNQKKSLGNTKPLTSDKETQTEPETMEYEPGPLHVDLSGPEVIPDPEALQKLEQEKQTLLKDQAQKEKTIINLNRSYEKLEEKSKKDLESLKKQLQTKEEKIKELSEMEKNVDNLLKGIKDLNKQID